jgi:hypothetical protein
MPHPIPILIRIVNFSNRTTRTELKAKKNERELPAAFCCFSGQGMLVQIPPRSCAKGHRVDVGLEVRHGTKTIRFPVSAEVREVVKGEPETIALEFVGFEKTDWEWIQSIHGERQDGVTDLFMKLKEG